MTAPEDNPDGFLVELLGKYFPAGWIQSVIRTWVPVGIGAVVAWLAVDFHIVISAGASATAGIVAAGVVMAGYYALARLIEAKFPKVGRWMLALNLVKAKIAYVAPTETAHITDTAQGTARVVKGVAVRRLPPTAPPPPSMGGSHR